MKKLIVFGNGEFASMAKYYFSERTIEFFCVDDDYCKEDSFEKVPILSKSDLLKMDIKQIDFFVAISYKNMNNLRKQKYIEFKELGFNFISFIHEKSYISKKSTIGENCFILENQTIQKNVCIENNVFMWSGNHIGHNSKIKQHSYLSSHVVISGNCEIGENCFFGVNSAVKHNTVIGNECMVNMGAIVTTNLSNGSVVIPEKSKIFKSEDKISKLIRSKI